ncbi:fused MFS/spermidine synthase [Curvibacter sp. HBC61]|uniref:Fused MFS/spermidine synthase n=1 Tax=Curvibacter cyanobacteriorum TaxID=3026422 RepID=A0ABT5MVQ7_9BURK|nr:fused MFS/spermidine synthase [Curvibacter sp. HBC61]MDD0838143.1 fused MFS/spermidine synthase [Curvibacter sp. HBC61]
MNEAPPLRLHIKPYVSSAAKTKSLHFSTLAVQSTMSRADPDALVLSYTRTMMGFLLFKPQPGSIISIGLGGGSVPKFCHRYLPHTRQLVVEINPHVMALREEFQIPPDSDRFEVRLGDGAQFIQTADESCDVLLLDGYQSLEMPAQLCSEAFYQGCHRCLREDGILVANLHAYHPDYAQYLARLAEVFDQSMLVVRESGGTNSTVFAFKGPLPTLPSPFQQARPPSLEDKAWRQLSLAFERVYRARRALMG